MQKLRDKLKLLLDPARFRHSILVENTAVKLAKIHGADIKKAAVAGLLHDCAKWMDPESLLKKAKQLKIELDPFFKIQPKLLHCTISSYFAHEYFSINDKNILLAIKNHTIGRIGMTKLEKIIYVADHIEPGRTYKNVAYIRQIARKNLNSAIVKISTEMIQYLLDNDLPIFPETVNTMNYYLDK